MNTRHHGLAVLARFMRRSFALACVTSLLMTSSAKASTVLQFAQVLATDSVTATESGGVTTLSTTGNADGALVSIPVVVSNFNGSPFNPLTPVFETFVGVTSTGTATTSGGTISQTFSGTIEFTSLPGGAGLDYLTAKFTNAIFAGSGNSASLTTTAPNVTFTSGLAAFGSDTGMALGFTGVTPTVGITDGSVASFKAQNAGTFSATIVPEPSALCLASFAAVIGTLAAYGKKRMKNEPAN
jgi:hypothetical protein